MIYCPPERCAVCQIIPGSEFCLRRQARQMRHLAHNVLGGGVRAALQDLAADLECEATVEQRFEAFNGRDFDGMPADTKPPLQD